MWIRSGDIRDRSLKSSEIAPNFACFGPPISLEEGSPPEFLDLHYKAAPDCDHVAKFDGDRPRELGGSLPKEIKKGKKEKKTSRVKHKAFRNYRSERPNKTLYVFKHFCKCFILHVTMALVAACRR